MSSVFYGAHFFSFEKGALVAIIISVPNCFYLQIQRESWYNK